MKGRMELLNKVALVTGSSSGIGNAIAKKLLEEGAYVFGCGLEEESDINHQSYAYRKADLTDLAQAKEVKEACVKNFGRIDILVNCAGITGIGNIENTSSEAFKKQFEVNMFAVYNMCKATLEEIRKSEYGSIINIASELGVKAVPDRVAYCPAKAAVVMFTKCLAIDCGPNVRVNGILPALTETPMTMGRFQNAEKPDEFREKMNSRYILKRMGKPEDVANGAVFLASEKSSYITGEMLPVCGGGHIYTHP